MADIGLSIGAEPREHYTRPGNGGGSAHVTDGMILSRAAVGLAVVAFAIGYPGLYLDGPAAQLRYVIYLAPILLAAPLLYAATLDFNRSAAAGLAIFLAFTAAYYGQPAAELPGNFWVNAVIIPLCLLAYVPEAHVNRTQINRLFLVIAVCSAISFALTSHGNVRIFAILSSGTGTGLVEAYGSHEGLVAPIFTLFFYAIGAKLWAAVAFAVSVVGGKRIGLAALAAGLVVLFLLRRSSLWRGYQSRFWLLLIAFTTINVVSVNLTAIAETSHRQFGLRIPIEEVMLGRHNLGREINHSLERKSTVELATGSGPGAAESLAGERLKNGAAYLPHNDWLKIFYDFGLLGSVLTVIGMALVFSFSPIAAAIGVASAITMMTDNVIIYLFYQFPIAMMLAYLRCTPDGEAGRETGAAPRARRPVAGLPA